MEHLLLPLPNQKLLLPSQKQLPLSQKLPPPSQKLLPPSQKLLRRTMVITMVMMTTGGGEYQMILSISFGFNYHFYVWPDFFLNCVKYKVIVL